MGVRRSLSVFITLFLSLIFVWSQYRTLIKRKREKRSAKINEVVRVLYGWLDFIEILALRWKHAQRGEMIQWPHAGTHKWEKVELLSCGQLNCGLTATEEKMSKTSDTELSYDSVCKGQDTCCRSTGDDYSS
jgi:hypothetical protein